MQSLNERYAILHTAGAASVYVSRADFLPIQDNDLKRRLANEVVLTGHNAERPIYRLSRCGRRAPAVTSSRRSCLT